MTEAQASDSSAAIDRHSYDEVLQSSQRLRVDAAILAGRPFGSTAPDVKTIRLPRPVPPADNLPLGPSLPVATQRAIPLLPQLPSERFRPRIWDVVFTLTEFKSECAPSSGCRNR